MKAISLWQPWASLMALGYKKVETRSWATKHRGLLAIHATKKIIGWPSIQIQVAFDGIAFQPSDLPLGCLLCIVDLYDIKNIFIHNRPSEPERFYGDYTPGRFMWKTKNVLTFAEPIPFKGRQKIFNVPYDPQHYFVTFPNTERVKQETAKDVLMRTGETPCH